MLRAAVTRVLALSSPLLLVACGSQPDDPKAPAKVDYTALCGADWMAACTRAGCDPTSGAWTDCRINGWAGYVAPPFCAVSSGYAGDDQALCAPDPALGFQLHYGPSSYDDVSAFVLAAGDDSNNCVFLRAPAEPGRFIGQIIGRSRGSAHHLQINYAAAADETRVEGSVGPCGSIDRTQFVAISQSAELAVPDLSIARPETATDAGGLDFEGGAAPVEAGRMMELTAHFINTTADPILREGWINLYYRPRDQVIAEIHPVSIIGFGINVPAHSTGTKFRRSCKTAVERKVAYLQGHSHVGMQRLSVWKYDAASSQLGQIYEDYDPLEPATLYYNPFIQNAAFDAASRSAGGASGPLSLAAGDSLVWECEFDNASPRTVVDGDPKNGDQMCYVFGGHDTALDTGSNWTCLEVFPSSL